MSAEWTPEIPWDDFPGDFIIKGTGDADDAAFEVSVVTREMPPETSSLWPYESVQFGMSALRLWDVVGRGKNEKFERRPLYEVEGVLWRKP